MYTAVATYNDSEIAMAEGGIYADVVQECLNNIPEIYLNDEDSIEIEINKQGSVINKVKMPYEIAKEYF